MTDNVCNLAPCHLPDIDPTIDHTLARPTSDFPCSICKSPADADRMLLCDGCGKGYHTFCLTPKLTAVPEGTWLCAGCTGSGITVQEVHRRAQAVAAQPAAQPLQEVFTTRRGRDRARAAQLPTPTASLAPTLPSQRRSARLGQRGPGGTKGRANGD
ncbi:hypothetical protein QJQ45_000030 [Haematococcus lacustris]|nr:hypothetical protein QJQ45_000030 [Haematococcus lacustris]